MTSILLFCYLLLGGLLGGLLSSIASMASLATYPVLLSAGVLPIYANVTNDAALIWTSLGSTMASMKELHGHWRKVWTYASLTTLGAIAGSFLLLAFPSRVFEKLVPFFIGFSGIMILISGHKAKKEIPKKTNNRWTQFWGVLGLLTMGAYTGYFGAAGGVIVLVILDYLMDENFLVINAIKNVLCGMANLVALIIYSVTSKIYWAQAFPLAIGMLIGGYVGPRLLRHLPVKGVRIFIALLAFSQAAYFAYKAFF